MTFGAEKRAVNVGDKTALGEAIGRKFRLDTAAFTLQYWYSEFNEWVDADDFTELPDSCRLQVFLKGLRSRLLNSTSVHRHFRSSVDW